MSGWHFRSNQSDQSAPLVRGDPSGWHNQPQILLRSQKGMIEVAGESYGYRGQEKLPRKSCLYAVKQWCILC